MAGLFLKLSEVIMFLLKLLFLFIKKRFDVDIMWALGVISLLIYGTIRTQIEFDKSIQRNIEKTLEIEGYSYNNISDIIIERTNRTEEIVFLKEKNLIITTGTINRKKKLIIKCRESREESNEDGIY